MKFVNFDASWIINQRYIGVGIIVQIYAIYEWLMIKQETINNQYWV